MNRNIKFIGIMVFITLIAACSTTVGFKVYDYHTGVELNEYVIQVDGKTLQPGETIKLTTASWKEFKTRVQAEGYQVEVRNLDKTVYSARMIVGVLFFWPEIGWCYGPEEEQVFYLIKDKE